MVKDLRTNLEKGNAQGVLDGDLDDFIEASLAARVGNQRQDSAPFFAIMITEPLLMSKQHGRGYQPLFLTSSNYFRKSLKAGGKDRVPRDGDKKFEYKDLDDPTKVIEQPRSNKRLINYNDI